MLKDIKKISNISLKIKDGTPVIKIRKKELSINNFLLTLKAKSKSYIVDLFEYIGHPFTRIRLYFEIINKLDLEDSSRITKIKNLIKKGNYVSGYVPYEKEQISLLIYNFYSTNYGIRSPSEILIGLVDNNFKPCYSFLFDISFRQILSINPDEYFKEIEKKDPKFCVVLQINERIEPDHGKSKYNKKGGHLRFFGIYNQFSAFNHCFFMPHPSIFSRRIAKSLYPLISLERMVYIRNKFIKKIEHISPFYNSSNSDIRGDLSGVVKALPGYTIYKTEQGLVSSIFHTTNSFSRSERQTPFFNWISHLVALPPIDKLDVEMFFGECCSDRSEFKVQLVEIKDINQNDVEIVREETLQVDISDSISLSQIFPGFDYPKYGGWVIFKPISGKHSEKYINMFYKTKDNNRVFDGVHSHNFHKNKGRTLKFAPIPLSLSLDNKDSLNKLIFKTHLMIMGHLEKDINARIRLYSSSNTNTEEVIPIKISKKKIFLINDLHEKLLSKYENLLSKNNFSINRDLDYGICQLESEETNLQANLYIAKYDENGLKSLAVDHFTGG